ncbi:MAG: hypothetical protein K2H20_03190, partial [Bacilli bacterium]|nr:hypothetical protein [Bacilli bacterium]
AYDKDTLYLFKQYIENSDLSASYLDLLQMFLETTMILPDISRKVIFQVSNFKTCLREEDLIDKEYIWNSSNISLEGTYKVAFPVIESYIRARNYAHELTIAKGLSNSVENEIKLKIKYSKLPNKKPEK